MYISLLIAQTLRKKKDYKHKWHFWANMLFTFVYKEGLHFMIMCQTTNLITQHIKYLQML